MSHMVYLPEADVYKFIEGKEQWEFLGTGLVSCRYSEEQKGFCLCVESDDGALVQSLIVPDAIFEKECAKAYALFWFGSDTKRFMSLQFYSAEGFHEIWDQIDALLQAQHEIDEARAAMLTAPPVTLTGAASEVQISSSTSPSVDNGLINEAEVLKGGATSVPPSSSRSRRSNSNSSSSSATKDNDRERKNSISKADNEKRSSSSSSPSRRHNHHSPTDKEPGLEVGTNGLMNFRSVLQKKRHSASSPRLMRGSTNGNDNSSASLSPHRLPSSSSSEDRNNDITSPSSNNSRKRHSSSHNSRNSSPKPSPKPSPRTSAYENNHSVSFVLSPKSHQVIASSKIKRSSRPHSSSSKKESKSSGGSSGSGRHNTRHKMKEKSSHHKNEESVVVASPHDRGTKHSSSSSPQRKRKERKKKKRKDKDNKDNIILRQQHLKRHSRGDITSEQVLVSRFVADAPEHQHFVLLSPHSRNGSSSTANSRRASSTSTLEQQQLEMMAYDLQALQRKYERAKKQVRELKKELRTQREQERMARAQNNGLLVLDQLVLVAAQLTNDLKALRERQEEWVSSSASYQQQLEQQQEGNKERSRSSPEEDDEDEGEEEEEEEEDEEEEEEEEVEEEIARNTESFVQNTNSG